MSAPEAVRFWSSRAGVGHVDAVWITHPHADHLHGIDDLRVFTVRSRSVLPTHVSRDHAAEIRRRFPYIFHEEEPLPGTSRPRIELLPFDGDDPVTVLGEALRPLPVPHGRMTVYGFRAGDLGYVTDAKALPAPVLDRLQGVRTLVLNALWWGNPHPTHLNVEEAVEVAERVGADRTFLIHLTHRVGHADLESRLPATIRPAYDGLTLEVGP